jgi:RHS repeat-associated protein
VLRTAAGVTTMFFAGVWDETMTGVRTLYYTFNGQVVAMRTSAGVTYLHGDHLGSMTWAFNASGVQVGGQEYGPWGQVRAGSVPTSVNYTGQRLDSSGLLYYHARYYNPVLGRFISADSVVPGNASGGMDGVALKGLTVDFHEPGFVAQIAGENNQPFWFQLSNDDRRRVGSPWGPANPQALNRYSYVQNNPLKYTDPTGHCIWDACVVEVAVVVVLVGGALAAVAASPNSGMRMGDYDWTDWSIPGLKADTPSAADTPADAAQTKNPSWRDLKSFRGKTRTNGETGKNKRYYEKDYTHGDVEVYDSTGKHLGSMDPDTGEMTKPPVPGRKIKV